MRLSTKGRYGARLMLELALHYGQGPILLKDVAEQQQISEKYLGHLISPLKAAGLINSSRGAHGGYILAKPPHKVTLSEILKAVEGNLTLVECVNAPRVCNRVDSCVTRDIWQYVTMRVTEALESITLQNMVERQRQKQESQFPMYSI